MFPGALHSLGTTQFALFPEHIKGQAQGGLLSSLLNWRGSDRTAAATASPANIMISIEWGERSMELFEFLMVLLSLIVGLGLAEILTGFGRFLREGQQDKFSWIHSTLAVAVFLGLLQTFWESWSLRAVPEWTFPAMLLMLASPTLLLIIAHILFPSPLKQANLKEYYFTNPRLPWRLAAATVVLGTFFRPIAFGAPLFVWDHASGLPMIVVCVTLATSQKRVVHYVLVPFVAAMIVLDTLFISYVIR